MLLVSGLKVGPSNEEYINISHSNKAQMTHHGYSCDFQLRYSATFSVLLVLFPFDWLNIVVGTLAEGAMESTI